MIITYALNQSGVSTNDVELVAMKAAQMTDALKAGQIDAMICWEPYSSIAVNKALESYAVLKGYEFKERHSSRKAFRIILIKYGKF